MRANNANGFQPASLYEVIEDWAERTPEAIAITAPDRTPQTYRRLRAHLANVIQDLRELGIGPNDRVAVVAPNGPDMALAFLSVSAAATFVPLNPAYRAAEFDFYLSDLKPKALMVPSGIDSPAPAVARKHSIPIIEWSPVIEGEAGAFTLSGNAPKGVGSSKSETPDSLHFAQGDDIALILYTSGTTSKPKRVPLTHANLLTSARNIAGGLHLTEKDRCLNVMPLFHIHGLVGGVLSSLVAGSSVICASGFDPERFFVWLKEFRPTWYTAVPTIHQAVLSCAEVHKETLRDCSLRFIRSSSAALAPGVMQELEDLFQVPVIEAYGMTEAAHQIAGNPLPPLERKPGSVGLPVGTEVAVVDEKGETLPAGATGEILVRGANVIRGYENNAEINGEGFTDGWLRTGDMGYLDEDGYLFITARLKEIINRGGEKVSPREIDEALLEQPGISEAAAFAVPHPTLGEDIAAAVVTTDGVRVTEPIIREHLLGRLAEFKMPSRIYFVEEIPKNATGKVQRAGLTEKFSREAEKESILPKDRLEEIAVAIYAEVLGVEKVGAGDNFFALGGDSLRATQVISRVRTLFQVNLPIATLFKKSTPAELATEIAGLLDETDPAVLAEVLAKDV